MTHGFTPDTTPIEIDPAGDRPNGAGGARGVTVRGLGFGIATGAALGALLGTAILLLAGVRQLGLEPLGTILGGFIGGVIGLPAGVLHGLAMTLPATMRWRRATVRLYSAAYAGAIGAAITGAWAAMARPGASLTGVVVIGLGGASGLAGLLDGPAIAAGCRSSTRQRDAGAALLICTTWGAALGALVTALITLVPAGPTGEEVGATLLLLTVGGAVGGLVLGIACVALSLRPRTTKAWLR